MSQITDLYKIEMRFEPRSVRHFAKFISLEVPGVSYDFPVNPQMLETSKAVLGPVFIDIVNKIIAGQERAQADEQAKHAKIMQEPINDIDLALKD